MKRFQTTGGVAALIAAATFVVGLVLYFTVLAAADYGNLEIDPVRNAAFLADNQTIMYAWHITIYVVFGVFLLILALALYDRLKDGSRAVMQTATALGLIWAGLVIASGMVANIGMGVVVNLYGRDPVQAGSIWMAQHLVVDGLGGGNEIVGGLWVLLVSGAALRAGGLPRALNYLGVATGAAGVVTVIPALGQLGVVFGLGEIVWFVWLGIVMLGRVATKTA